MFLEVAVLFLEYLGKIMEKIGVYICKSVTVLVSY